MNKIRSDEFLIIVIASSTSQWYPSSSTWPLRDLTTQTSSDSWEDVLKEFDMEANELHRTKKVSNMDGNGAAGGGGPKTAPVKVAPPAEPPEEVKGVKKVDPPKQVPNQKAKDETPQEKKPQQNQPKPTNAEQKPKEAVEEAVKEAFQDAPRNNIPSITQSGVSKRSGKSLHHSQPLLTLFGSNDSKNPSSELIVGNVDSHSEIGAFAILEQAGLGMYEDYLYRRLALTRSKLRRHQTNVYSLLTMALDFVRQHPYVVEALQYVREHVWKMLTYNKTATFFTGLVGIVLLIVFIVKHAAVFCLRLFLEILLYAFIIDVMLC